MSIEKLSVALNNMYVHLVMLEVKRIRLTHTENTRLYRLVTILLTRSITTLWQGCHKVVQPCHHIVITLVLKL